jgi:hypothetical protein
VPPDGLCESGDDHTSIVQLDHDSLASSASKSSSFAHVYTSGTAMSPPTGRLVLGSMELKESF